MDTANFLELVWPESGPYLLAIPIRWTPKGSDKEKKGFKHFVHHSVDTACNHAAAIAWDRDNPKDVYFAMGSIQSEKPNPDKPREVRKAYNIAQVRAYWVDLDVGPDEKKYPTQKAAVLDLRKFCEKAGLPKPYLVNSGYGIHVYWPLSESVPRDTWTATATLLKQLTKRLGLKADPTRTADCASVLRVVGTANYKQGNPKPVEVVMPGDVTTQDEFHQRVVFAMQALGEDTAAPAGALSIGGSLPQAAIAKGAELNREASTANQAPPSDPKRVVRRCLQLQWQLFKPDEVPEPSWYDMVGCLRHCDNGAFAVHKMSSRHPEYSKQETDDKIEHHREGGIGPTLCSTFEEHNPGGCEGCPHRGKIKSPIVLGHQLEKADTVTAEVGQGEATAEVEIPPPPYPFQRVKHPLTGEVQIAIEVPGDDDEPAQDIIYEHDLYPSGISYDERESRFKATMRRLLPKDGWDEFTFPLGDLFDRRTLARLMGNIGVLPDSGNMDLLVQYMIGYLKQLQNQAAASVIYAQLGWRDNDQAFILPDRVVSASGAYDVAPSSNIDNALAWTKHPPIGDLDAWKAAVAGYERPGMEALQFLFGVGFGAPLFRFTAYAGMVVSAVGPSGCGKSTAALCANSVWGHPHMGWADVENDTVRAFYNKLGVLRHLPVTYDEITNLDADTVSSLCYAVSKGQGRQRLEQDGSAKANHGDWQTMMITTSNASLHSRLAGAKADASAETVRVFEFYVPPQTITKAQADAQFLPVMQHYGLAGPVYAQGLTAHTPWVKNKLATWSKALDKAAHIASSERFWSAGAACVLAGFELSNKLGLTNVDLERQFQFVVSTIARMRGVVQDNTRTPVSILADYLNGNLRNTLVISMVPEGGRNGMVTHAPTGELRVRYEVWCDRLYIDRAHFRRFCQKIGVDAYQIRRALVGEKVLLGDNARMVLGKNTSFSSAQTTVWTVDMAHPSVSGLKTLADIQQQPEDPGYGSEDDNTDGERDAGSGGVGG